MLTQLLWILLNKGQELSDSYIERIVKLYGQPKRNVKKKFFNYAAICLIYKKKPVWNYHKYPNFF